MADNNNPIQVKKVSALPVFNEYYSVIKNDKNELEEIGKLAEAYKDKDKSPLDNAFVMIAFPDNSSEYPHNYKISLSDFSSLIVTSFNNEMNKVNTTINNLEQMLNNTAEKLKSYKESDIINYWLYTETEFNKFISGIAEYCPSDKVAKIKEHWARVNNIANEYWNIDETDTLDDDDVITHFNK